VRDRRRQVFALALPLATRIYLTRVHATEVSGDVYFPLRDFSAAGARANRWRTPPMNRHAYAMSFVTLEHR
jgi:dihydrofolate reductase